MAIPVSPIPGTFFEWDDQSDITVPEISVQYQNPIYCAVITADKGKENWQLLAGQDFFDMYAVNNLIEFKKHGQPLLQTAMSINAGAQVLCKRIVADDATLANICVVAIMKTVTEQATNEDGQLLYRDPEGNETIWENDGEPIMNTTTTLTYDYRSAQNCKTQEEVIDAIQSDIEAEQEAAEEGTKIYPLWIVFDNGRGASRKRIRIIPNYQLSKTYDQFFMYDLQILEGNNYFPTIHFVLNPNMIYTGSNVSFQYKVNTETVQIDAYQFSDSITEFMNDVIAGLNLSAEVGAAMDLLFCTDKKGKPIAGINVDYDGGVDLSLVSGQLLLNGDNGSFGDCPIKAEGYGAQAAKAFAGYIEGNPVNEPVILTKADGVYDPIIYNVDRYKIDIIFDANYPKIVKRAIESLVSFREDCMFYRDLGTKCNTLDLIRVDDDDNLHSIFCSTYCTYYDIIDPYSKKQVTVTMMYHMAQLAVNQFNTSRSAPMAGIKYGFTITDIVEDTIGFIPTICPELNEKEDLFDMRINYATYIDNKLVVESLYTSQDKYSQLSFSNNVLAVQQVVKTIRTMCPASRYTFIDGDDLNKYRAEIEGYIEQYQSNFNKLEVTYLQDPYYTENKIFYAALAVQFRGFVQTELFKITALSSSKI